MSKKKLFEGKVRVVPFSSVVGSSMTIEMEGLGCVAMLMISVPQVHFDYRQVSEAVAEAFMQKTGGKVTLVLPEGFGDQARQRLAEARARQALARAEEREGRDG